MTNRFEQAINASGVRVKTTFIAAVLVLVLATNVGCHLVSSARHAVPAFRLDPTLTGSPKESLAPLPYAMLGQDAVNEHIIGAGDTLSIYVYGVLPPNRDATPIAQRTQTVNQQYYPPNGAEEGSRTGVPIHVDSSGGIELPLVKTINVAGLTLPAATEKILQAYRQDNVLQQGRERVTVDLYNARVKRIIVLREDSPSAPVSMVTPGNNNVIHRGSGQVIDLPIYENDVLHALASTGGLPGTDAKRELWVIRSTPNSDLTYLSCDQIRLWTEDVDGELSGADIIRIPLVGCPGGVLPFSKNDVILNDGDVLYVPRRSEHFVSGGLLPGARIPLPRDSDVDVLEAIALANGSVGGPLGQSGAVLKNGSPGFMREPTRVVILRKLPDGRQMPIRVDLDRVVRNEKERILIQPDDVVMLYFKPSAALLNGALNFVNFNIRPGSGSGSNSNSDLVRTLP